MKSREDSRETAPMARYYFHSSDSRHGFDDLGLDLADDKAAQREAIRFGAELLRDDPDIINDERPLRVHVMDENNRFCFAVVIIAIAPLPRSA